MPRDGYTVPVLGLRDAPGCRWSTPATSQRPSAVSLGVASCAWLAMHLAAVGEFDRGLTVAEEGASARVALDPAYNRLVVSFGLAVPRLFRGDHAGAIPVLERALAIARELNTQNWLPGFVALLGYAHALSGRLTEALVLLEEAVARVERTNRIGRGLWLSLLSEAYLLAGRSGDAIATAQRGLEGTRQRHERPDEARLLRTLAEATAQTDPPDFAVADRLYREALALAEHLGMRPVVARCHAGLAKLCGRTSHQAESNEHRQAATTMYRQMGMTYWLEKAEQDLKELA